MSYNKLSALRDNHNAIIVAWQVSKSATGIATEAERAALKKFSGFGGIKEVQALPDLVRAHDTNAAIFNAFSITDRDMQAEVLKLKVTLEAIADGDAERAKQLADGIATSVETAFYTPQPVIDAVGDAVQHTLDVLGIEGASLLETSAGIGGFLSIATSSLHTTVAFEKDPITAMILRALHPGTAVYADGFETIDQHREQDEELIPEAFDVVASNIPYSNGIPVFDPMFSRGDDAHRKSTEKLHTYFFLKGMEQLEDGGILAFITTRGIADSKQNAYVRQWLVEHGDLLAVLRLPDNLFEQGSGVEVGSDLIIFQRNSHKAWQTTNEKMFTESLYNKTVVIDGEVKQIEGVNRLLSLSKQAIFTHRKVESNQYGRTLMRYYWRSGWDIFEHELRRRLKIDMERAFKLSTWAWGHDEERKARERAARDAQDEKSRRRREERAKKTEEMRPIYDRLREAYFELRDNERRDKVADNFGRDALNEAYDEFFTKFGTLHKNESIINQFEDSAILISLEKKEGKAWVKADIFDHPIDFRQADGSQVVQPMDALSMSLNEHGCVNLRYMQTLTGLREDALYDALRGEIFYYPEDSDAPLTDVPLVWWHKHALINGNLIQRRKRAEEYRALGGLSQFDAAALDDSIRAIEEATPTPIPYDDIRMQLGQRWIPTEFYERFAVYIFKSDRFKIEYIRQIDRFSFSMPWGGDWGLGWHTGPWCAKGHSGFNIFDYALHDNAPSCEHTKKEYDPTTGETKEVKRVDEEELREVNMRMDDMRDAFVDYMASDEITSAERAELARLYNEHFNCSIHASFDGSHQTFPGLDLSKFPFDDLYQSQKDCIWMLKNNFGGICWHEVGGGKTMIACITAIEMKRIGRVNKPMIIAMNANVAQVYDTMIKAYPKARILYPGTKFTEKNLVRIFEQIALNDWDCIILSHDQFKRLPQSCTEQKAFINAQLDELNEVIRLARGDRSITKEARRGIETRKRQLEKELNEVMHTLNERAADVLDFDQMGIDFLIIDESQEFKNGAFSTRHVHVKGLGKTSGNQMTANLAVAIRTIQKKHKRDLCAVFMSGTIISNSMTELYVVYKYLRPRALEQQGIYCFDAWASTFCKKASDFDLNAAGDIQQMERFREYINVPELSQFLCEVTDYRNAEMINLDRPKANIIEDFVDPHPEQADLIEKLKLFAASGNTGVFKLTEKELNYGRAGMSFATPNLARDIAMDVRLMGEHQFHDHPTNKAHRCAARIAEYYKKYDAHKGTQFVFCDISVDKKNGKWSLYRDVKEKLVSIYGIPAKEIQFIQDHHTPMARKKLFDDMNDGKVRVLFGATKSLGTGVNAQRRAVAAHHLDIPWKPAEMDQRNGRVIRSGNEVKIWGNNTVDIIIYGTDRTLDAYKMRLLQIKSQFVNQVCDGSVSARTHDDGAFDTDGDSARIPYGEFVALLSGNTDMLTKTKLEARKALLEKQHKLHNKQVRAAKDKIIDNQKEIENKRKVIALQQRDLSEVKQYIAANGGVGLNVHGAKDQTIEEQGRRLFERREEDHREPITIASVCGELQVRMVSHYRFITDPVTHQQIGEQRTYNEFYVRAKSGSEYCCTQNGTLAASHADSVATFDALPLAIEKRIADNEKYIRYREKDIEALTVTANTEWTRTAELTQVSQELREVCARIDADIKAHEQNQKAEAAKVAAQ